MQILDQAVSPFKEMISYEALMGNIKKTYERSSKDLGAPTMLPSKYAINVGIDDSQLEEVKEFIEAKKGFSIFYRESFNFPQSLNDTKTPVWMFYAKGDSSLLDSNSVSVVGSRKVSDKGKARARRIATELVEKGFTIISGLAKGVDTEALTAAIKAKGKVIGVIGTPLDEYYPKENRSLQDLISHEHLLISQVPFFRYSREPFSYKKFYFPIRNQTMSALSQATVIVEASETSGTLTQARACLDQGRKLFILQSCFENKSITWPKRFEERGAIRVRETSDILNNLK